MTKSVALQHVKGIGTVQTFSGRHITIGGDPIVEMSEEDANYLIPYGWMLITD